MSYRNLLRTRYYLLPEEPYQFGKRKWKDPYQLSLYKFMQSFNLKHITRIEYAFDPFHESAKFVRNCMFQTSGEKIRASNPKCAIRSTVLTDRSDPTVRVQLVNGQHLLYNAANLTELEILQHIDKTKSVLDEETEAKA